MGWEAQKQGWSTTESGGSAIGELGQERREEEQKTTYLHSAALWTQDRSAGKQKREPSSYTSVHGL